MIRLAPASHMIYRDCCTAFDDILPRISCSSTAFMEYLHATSPLSNITIHAASGDSEMATSKARGLLDLPAELDHIIAQHLDTLDLMRMRITCSALYAAIPPPSLNELLTLERTIFRDESDIYTCGVCFADNMVTKKRSKTFASPDAGKRFCIDCGIAPAPETGARRYTRGSHIAVFGEQFVVCRSCAEFGEAAVEEGGNTSECLRCRPASRAREQRARRIAEEGSAQQEAERLRVEKTRRRAKRREIMGSEYEDSEYSPTESELWFDEADVYMGSPKAGSD